ncbi:putative GMC oxidoreductase [Xylariaceae sp. FL0662B]|nr:putative GMC oxidoreductase [Xylariaceae sp. FL0662B]
MSVSGQPHYEADDSPLTVLIYIEGIGGSTRMNAMLWTRGFPGDYAAWSEMGLGDWSYQKVEPYFRKIENAIAHPNSMLRGHDADSPYSTQLCPIELRQFPFPFVWTTYIEQAVQKLGLRLVRDINEPIAPAMGYFNLDAAIDKCGNRISALAAYPSKTVTSRRGGRLTVCTGAVASRLEADAQTGLITGVHIRCSKGSPREFSVKARREVIVCAGVVCTPQLLLLSGIRPTDSAEMLGIPLVKKLPAVGTTTVYVRTDAIDKNTMQVKSHDKRRDNLNASLSRNVPNIEIMFMPNSAVERTVEGRTLISLYPTLVQPRGTGRIELAGYPYPAKLAFAPGQDPTMLEEWEKTAPIDYLPVPASVASPISDKRKPHVVPEPEQGAAVGLRLPENKTWRNVTDDEIDEYMRRVSHTSLHFSSTCPMSNDEKSGVVDQKLRVHGFSNLRIADASVFPKIPSCHTMAPVMMVAERCADLVKAAWKESKSQ